MTKITDKLRLAFYETNQAMEKFSALDSERVKQSEVAAIRRILCAVTSKLVAVESELASEDEKRRNGV